MQKWSDITRGKVPVRLISWPWLATGSEFWQHCLHFIDFFEEGGHENGSSDTWYHCRREQEQDGRWYDKVLGSALYKRPVDLLPRAPLVRFSCFGASLAAFLILLSLYIYLLRDCSSVQQSAATLRTYVFCSACSCSGVIRILPHLEILLFLVV